MNLALRNPLAIGLLILAAVILLVNSVAIVPETKQAVILRLQQPQGVVNQYQPGERFGSTGAGIVGRIPFLDRVVFVDKRVLDVELDNQQVLSIDQLRLQVDAFARFRITNPLRAVVSTGSAGNTEQLIADRLQPILGSTLRNELGKRPFAALLSPERGQVMENIQFELNKIAGQYGAQIVDVRIKHADLPTGSPLDSALQRMRTARNQEALTIQAQGRREAQIVQANAQAQAAQIYAQSFGKDADFYEFWRAMQSYRRTFGADGSTTTGETSIILSPNNAYLRQFEGGGR
ncbi:MULTISPECIES: protease modulator HflC [unclassified Sphingomonas]|jgi:membrane protease subunit HflC|uniref:protease modulator HflC n=1 Tax=unclassified Sphingomonas TaxID=196159 RepID=UPI00082C1878|nr:MULTISPECIES: protease modulator HflC [unclassified Sphingomonas]MCH4893817.1 protease modulator HflC [Sphingomonas sp. SFZ2018-12]